MISILCFFYLTTRQQFYDILLTGKQNVDQNAMEDTCTPSQALEQTPARGSPDGRPGASQPQWGSHPVNIRFTIPLLFRSYYITIVVGPERRSEERRASERQKHPLFTLGNVIVYLLAGTGWGVALLTLFQLLTIYTLRNGSLVLGVSVGLLLFVGLIGFVSLFLWGCSRWSTRSSSS